MWDGMEHVSTAISIPGNLGKYMLTIMVFFFENILIRK